MAVSQRSWALGGAAVGVLMVGATYLIGVGPALSHNSSLRSQAADAKQSNDLLSIQIDGLRKESLQLPSFTAQLAAAKLSVPAQDNLDALTREINTLAGSNSLGITSISPSAPTVTSASGAPTAAASSTAGGSPVGKLFSIPVSIVVTGTAANEIKFVASLHATGSRAVLINSVQTAWTGGTAKTATMTIAAQIFVAP
jgi:Tfp pilus assembly protein PilO